MPKKPRYTVSTAAGPAAAPTSQIHTTPMSYLSYNLVQIFICLLGYTFIQYKLWHTDGTHDTSANTSSAQQRARAPPPLHSGNGARQSRVNAIPFRPPRNEAQLAPSSDIGDARAPATNKKQPDLDEVVDDQSEDENYDPEADEVESFDDHVDDLFAACELTVNEALALPPRKKIVLNHNRELQQVGQAAGLLSGFLGTLASDFEQFPIGEKSWKTISKASKEHAFGQFKRVFHYEDDGKGIIKRGIVQRIENFWRNARNHLFHKVYDEELTFDQNLKRKPAGIEANHWKKFLEYRLNEDTKEKCKTNTANCSKQLYTHTRGSKMMARKRHEKKSDYGVQIEEYHMEIVKLKAEAAELKAESAELKAAAAEKKAKRQRMEADGKVKMQSMGNLLRYIIQEQGGSLPPEIAADLDLLRSAPTSSHTR
ncbi:hypothetical protein Ahy_A07g036265 [Arachis hypogaea]|uniref:Transposase, Ptta/En/Spm, plant n=1 Tax=Arachis hypogaea TaxID=3818 RepID=A0A445CFQ0_ARAHY|nr:hypothetical protein Ahy_A07g036265 [Arachis hypogaea]